MSVGKNIRQCRENLGMSQNRLSQKSRVGQSSIHYIESEKNSPTIDTLKKIAKALGVLPSELLDENEKTNFPKSKMAKEVMICCLINQLFNSIYSLYDSKVRLILLYEQSCK
jgi:transcriptional regulator with XRE-family HTH domain